MILLNATTHHSRPKVARKTIIDIRLLLRPMEYAREKLYYCLDKIAVTTTMNEICNTAEALRGWNATGMVVIIISHSS